MVIETYDGDDEMYYDVIEQGARSRQVVAVFLVTTSSTTTAPPALLGGS